MSKILFVLCLIAILATFVVAELTAADEDNTLSETEFFPPANRAKRGVCKAVFKARCCGKHACDRQGCFLTMCALCCS
ncbi:unnamed protein product, partial [Mesorhabditis spiculigera]